MSNSRSSPDPTASFEALRRELLSAVRDWERAGEPWPRERFDRLARRAFRLQVEAVPAYAAYCARRGVGPADVAGWTEVPPVPTAAFREVSLEVRGVGEPAVVFRTSGTSRGRARRGRHPVLDPEIYRVSLEATFRWHILGGADRRIRMVSLVPPFADSDGSSLAWMYDALLGRFGGADSLHCAGPDGIDFEGATRAAAAAAAKGTPLCVLATTLAADAWTRHLAARGEELPLSAGSVLVDTGGAKGRPELERAAVVRALGRWLALPPSAVVNEFGMTELLSQRYSRPLGGPLEAAGAGAGEDSPLLYGPPWLRTRVLDPETLAPLPEGERGVLCHFDLANIGSVCAVLTEDLGRARGDALEYLGRPEAAPPRGCSLATAELLAATEHGE